MEQHPVPQNVTTFQFRLIGDMTIKQFGYLLGGAILGFLCTKLPLPTFFSYPIGAIILLFGAGMAFVPIEERPMDVWVLSFIKSIYNPTLYTWKRQKQTAVSATTQAIDVKSTTIEKTQNPLVQQTAPTNPVVQPAAIFPQPFMTPKPEQTDQLQKPPVKEPEIMPPPQNDTSTEQKQAAPQSSSEKEMPKQSPPTTSVATPTITPPFQPKAEEVHQTQKKPSLFGAFLAWLFPKPASKNQTVTLPAPQPENKTHVADRQTDILTGVFAHRAKTTNQNNQPQQPSSPIRSDPFANMHMPDITGKQIEKITEEKPKEELNTPSAEDQKHLDELGANNKNLENKLADLALKLQEKSGSEDRIVELQKQLTDVLSERQAMETELTTLRTKLTQQAASPPQPTQTAGVTQQPERRGPTVRIITPEGAISAGLPKLTTYPNVVTGIIKDYDKNLLPGVLVTVRDKDSIPLRALKTNKLGQFAASTPLPNNTYFIEVEDPRGRFTFDRIQITLNGSLVPAIEVVAKSQKQIEREKLEKQIFGSQQF